MDEALNKYCQAFSADDERFCHQGTASPRFRWRSTDRRGYDTVYQFSFTGLTDDRGATETEGFIVDESERLKLLFGPYKAPPLKRGDRTVCVFRDCPVVITGWTAAPIPWPRCRALDGPGGGSGLLVDEELARAVRHESATAIMHWWTVSKTAVQNWRKALGVGRTDNEGTVRLMLAAAEKGAEAVQGREWSQDEREQRRRNAVAKNLARHLTRRYHGPCWTKQ
jgi:hypothetical protein